MHKRIVCTLAIVPAIQM